MSAAGVVELAEQVLPVFRHVADEQVELRFVRLDLKFI
jgi:hypothetical protein